MGAAIAMNSVLVGDLIYDKDDNVHEVILIDRESYSIVVKTFTIYRGDKEFHLKVIQSTDFSKYERRLPC